MTFRIRGWKSAVFIFKSKLETLTFGLKGEQVNRSTTESGLTDGGDVAPGHGET